VTKAPRVAGGGANGQEVPLRQAQGRLSHRSRWRIGPRKTQNISGHPVLKTETTADVSARKLCSGSGRAGA